MVQENSRDYDVIWIIDLDTLVKENKEKRIGSKSALQEIKEYESQLKKTKECGCALQYFLFLFLVVPSREG